MPVAALGMAESATERTQVVPLNDGGAPIEIWDVRRGFIAKWVVNDSVGEGGVRGLYIYSPSPKMADIRNLFVRYCIRRFSCHMGPTLVGGILTAGSALLQQTVERNITNSRYMGSDGHARFRDGPAQALGDPIRRCVSR